MLRSPLSGIPGERASHGFLLTVNTRVFINRLHILYGQRSFDSGLFQEPTVFSKRPFLVNLGGLIEDDPEI